MPCSYCNKTGHNIRTCISGKYADRRYRVQEIINKASERNFSLPGCPQIYEKSISNLIKQQQKCMAENTKLSDELKNIS